MNVVIFGATGMVGLGVLNECLRDASVEKVLTVGRTSTGINDPKLSELIHPDLWNYKNIETSLKGFDACFFCLGTPSAGKDEREYTRLTFDLTMAAAEMLLSLNSQMTFIYVSGAGADSSEQGSVMWARVRGRLENALFKLPFKAVYVFRPGVIEPLEGIKSKTTAYRLIYSTLKPFLPKLRALFPHSISTTADIGKAMISIAQNGYHQKILKTPDFYFLSSKDKT